jgi:hypothetical protein
MLSSIDDETYRRRILTQLKRGAGRHSVARAVFHGQRGELRQRYREGQEDQLEALGLVVKAIVLWNTMYMDAALNQLRAEGWEVNSADVARLSPLIHKHINFQGRYSFTLSESVAQGGLRPLRDPYEQNDSRELPSFPFHCSTNPENSYQPTRQRERRMQGCKSPGHAQHFLSAYGPIAHHFRPRRHRLSAADYRQEMRRRVHTWQELTTLPTAA